MKNIHPHKATRSNIDLAKKLAKTKQVGISPGWNFSNSAANFDKYTDKRIKIWKHFSNRRYLPKLVVRWDRNLKLTLNMGDDISWCLFVGGCIDPNELTFLKSTLRKGMVMVDVGANCGVYSLFASKRVGNTGKVIAIEPSSRELKRLVKNIKLNASKNIIVLPLALSDRVGKNTLHIATDQHNGQNTIGPFMYSGVELLRNEVVETSTLDKIFEKMQTKRLDFIKIDVEGQEMPVLLGGRKIIQRYKPTLLVEVSEKSASKIIAYLKNIGYILYFFDNLTGKPKKIEDKANFEKLGLNILAIHCKTF